MTKLNLLHEAVIKNLDKGANYLLTPEDSRYLNYQFGDMSDDTNVKLAQSFFSQSDSVIVDSGGIKVDDHSVLRGYILDVGQSSLYFSDKQYLVPQGEFIPYLYGTLFTAVGFGSAVERIKRGLSYRPSAYGDQSELPLRYPSLMFCFESINPRSAHQLAKRGNIPFVAHPISHAWFNQPTVLWQQQDVMLQMQARWAGVPIVSAGNMMVGKAYLPDGRIDYGTVIATGDRWEARLIEF